MKADEFDNLVTQLREDPLPDCPGNLEQNVLRRIRLSKTTEEGWLEWLSGWLVRPAVLATTLALVAVCSFLTATYLSQEMVTESPVAALGFDVFADSIILPTDH